MVTTLLKLHDDVNETLYTAFHPFTQGLVVLSDDPSIGVETRR